MLIGLNRTGKRRVTLITRDVHATIRSQFNVRVVPRMGCMKWVRVAFLKAKASAKIPRVNYRYRIYADSSGQS